MKHEKLISRLIAVTMAFFLALAGVGCIATGFRMDVDLGVVGMNILIFAVLVMVACSYKWGNLVLFVLVALFMNNLWYQQDLSDSAEGLIYWITARFDNAYHWGVIFWGGEPPMSMELETAFSVASIPVVWITGWTILRRKPAILAVPVAMLLPAVCFVLTNTVPDGWCLFLLCTILLLLILTQTVRRRSALEGNRLLAMLLVPAMLCSGLLFWAVPQEGYAPKMETPAWLANLFSGGTILGGTDQGASVDLTAVGPKLESRTEVMRVNSSRPGVLYLRGQAYDVYEGTTWSVSNVDTGKDRYWPTKNMVSQGEITITNRTQQTLRYLPYYVQNGAWMDKIQYGRLEGSLTKEYSFSIMDRVSGKNLNTSVTRDEIVEQCLQLPANTSVLAKEIVKQIGIGATYNDLKKAQLISEYVSNLVPYNTKTSAMPQDQQDFALWFLTEADSGYCVHFATAATVLLRAAGVPARYVTGYMINLSGGFGIVEQRHAHAWVEYLDSSRGWVVLDPTPLSRGSTVTEPTDPEPTETTTPTESTEPDVSTEPTESQETEPTEFQGTEPSVPTEPEESTVPEQTQPQRGAVNRDWSWLWNILKYGALIFGPIGLIAVQYFLRIGLRNRKRRRGDTNQKALADWREVNRLSRLLRQPIPEELEELAEKAKFSQYTLTAEEIGVFRNRITALQEILRSKNWLWRFVLKLVFAIE